MNLFYLRNYNINKSEKLNRAKLGPIIMMTKLLMKSFNLEKSQLKIVLMIYQTNLRDKILPIRKLAMNLKGDYKNQMNRMKKKLSLCNLIKMIVVMKMTMINYDLIIHKLELVREGTK